MGRESVEISPVAEEKVYGGKDLPKSQLLSSEWKNERVREDESGDSEDDEDELPCVIGGEREGDSIWRGSRSSVGISKVRCSVLKRAISDFQRRPGWWRYWGWFVVRTLYVRERSLYWIRSFILSQLRDLRTGVMWEDFGVKWQLSADESSSIFSTKQLGQDYVRSESASQ